MSGAKIGTDERTILDAATGVNPVGSRWLALYSTMPTSADPSLGVEVSTRQPIVFPASSGSGPASVAHTNSILFPAAPPGGYTALGCAILDASSAGVIRRFGAFAVPLVVASGGQASFPPGEIILTEG